MIFPKPYSIFKQTEEYREAFESGYNKGRNEIMEYISKMEALKTTTTISVCIDCPRFVMPKENQ